jgi:pyruvate formate lyase activating enzyme
MLDKSPTPHATLTAARRIAMEQGVRYVYIGNVNDVRQQSTYCHHCGTCLIERNWYALGAWRLDDSGRCLACGTACAGVFDGPPGTWGQKRLPVRLANVATAA